MCIFKLYIYIYIYVYVIQRNQSFKKKMNKHIKNELLKKVKERNKRGKIREKDMSSWILNL